ncbi:Retinoic acid induced 16-like protein-domain-containing protein [Boeremia exigua]|uniref:Retinoic acid induced 16-like protein-domain-containing protein n=1 Tax=Boeremia exigua TaxID=749465 RepID=UPI001E8E5968|nr:Retinoic acid induced 16-like protein-domain-containing protein [Boeremia exigua]KAH6625567.1 Retinoic acid induced 16-like protein-domain-containing protein [Boeremia exigua]
MDFWVRLLGGSSQKKQAAPNNPQQRLARFRQRYNQVLSQWQKTQNLANDREALNNIRRGFQALTAILNDESRSPAPHLCLQFAAVQQIYTGISKIAATSFDEGVVRDAVAFYNALIDSEEEDFLENDVFAVSLMNFINRTVGSGAMNVGEDIEADIVELLFGIAAKIRLQPEILPVWFTTTTDTASRAQAQGSDFAGVTQKEDFPLCYQLIDHVHHEGRIGDFARTGLLYVFESASKSMTLEQWIVNSDLPTLMASGLGALYSQLSRKLSILHPQDNLPLVLSFSDYVETKPNNDTENLHTDEFQSHIGTFLSYLAFWQDVLEHCRSADVRHTLIDHFHVLFLQQLLYPSLLESSDADGGSSVAVLTYLRRILDALDHPELVHMILQYLLALPDRAITGRAPRSSAAVKRRRTLVLMTQSEKEEERLNPSLFNLVDLILGSTDSRNSQTVTSALKLTTVILGKNHSYGLGSLIKVMNVHYKEPHRTAGALNIELETYLNLAIGLAGEDGVDEAYEMHLRDTQSLLESHPCSLKTLALPPTQGSGYYESAESSGREVHQHYLIPEDPLFKSLIELLLTFLTNDVETNLALTEAVINLGTCSQLRLEGWLSVDPADYRFEDTVPETIVFSNDSLRDVYMASRTPTWNPSATPQLLACIQNVHAQVAALRADVPDWDEHVTHRKNAFRFHEEMHDAMKQAVMQPKAVQQLPEAPVGSWTPQLPKHVLDNSATPSRAQSPRGRKDTLSEHKSSQASSPAPSKAASLASPPPGTSSPLQGGKRQTTLFSDIDANLAGFRQSDLLRRRIRFRRPAGSQDVEVMLSKYQPPPKEPTDDTSAGAETSKEQDDIREASLLHIITNVVVLQEFVLELVALMQVRASLFNEIKFS